jgi:exodeoxyribonuclease VII large subunit
MMQMPMFQPPTWSVTDLTRYLRDLFESEENLQDLWVEGEVSNLSRPTSGHLYFTLKDRNAALRCVMWRNAVIQQIYLPRDGDAIEIHGSISIYEASGNYQLYGDMIRPAGEGALYQEFLRLKAQLEVEGLFDPERKRIIPRWPETIGIVTSPTGAALRDILDTIRRRFPPVKVVLAATQVQGDQAPQGISSAIQALNHLIRPDLIILARGGGSLEDLMAFNDEQVARTIASSPVPIITGIGHETDFTIADFAADLRAPTPTAAAELATPNQADLRVSLGELNKDIHQSTINFLFDQRRWLEGQQNRLLLRTPLARIHRDQQRLDELNYQAGRSLFHNIEINRTYLAGLELRLNVLNPRAILGRGYSLVTKSDGSRVRSTGQVQPNDPLNVRVSDGEFEVRVQESGNIE